MFEKFKKFSLMALTLVVAFTSVAGSLAFVQPAHATAPVLIAESIPEKTKQILGQIYEGIKTAALNAVIRIVAYAMRKVAYDSAVWLASGGKGQTPFAHVESFGDYIKQTGDEAFGRGIEQLGKPFGMNLCKIPDIRTDLSLKVGLRMNLNPSNLTQNKPACSFSEFKTQWFDGNNWKSQYGDSKSLMERFNATLSVDDSDLGIQAAATQKIDNLVATEKAGALLQRQEGSGYLPKTSAIAGNIQTPAGIIKKDFEKNTPGDQQEKDEQQLSALLSAGDIKVLPTALGIFLNTLVSSMAKNFQEKGVLPFGICVGDYGGEHCQDTNSALTYEGLTTFSGRQAAEELFSGFLETASIKSVDEFDILGQLSSCDDSSNSGIYNCRADTRLVEGARRADTGTPITIGEALKEGILRKDWRLLPPTREKEMGNVKNCYNSAYCYSNIKILRQIRMLPLGFEIAAKMSDPDNPWKLEDVVSNFNSCAKNSDGTIKYDPVNYPYCHLIDPNWIIKVPPARCNAKVYGSILLSPGLPNRLEECADLSTCVAYNEDGSCQSYGYCAREKNTWDFPDKSSCQSQFSTCRSYLDPATNQKVAYLYRTLDTNYCDQGSVGCRYYSLTKDASGKWQDPGQNTNTLAPNGIFFNAQLPDRSNCSANSAGCSAFKVASALNGDSVYYRKAPDYLGCYDKDPGTPGIQWPTNAADLARIQRSPECSKYAEVCIPEEVGCTFYTPQNTIFDTPIPGRFSQADVCDAVCVGYAAYREMPSAYSNGQNLTYINPNTDQTKCSQVDAGCSSFTNLTTDAGGVEKVEHYSYLRPCIKPDPNKQKNFITYEGSSSGFQLKTYTLVADTDGSPKYFYRVAADKAEYDRICNEADYKAGKTGPDCRQFNDAQGAVYYRLLSKTIAVSESCTAYRLNSTELHTLPGIADKATCESEQKGFWDDTKQAGEKCQVCFQGGEYRAGSCFYNGLPAGVANNAGTSNSCSAAVDTCREFKGNSGNNLTVLINDSFDAESEVKTWAPGTLIWSPESTRSDGRGRSLGSNGNPFVSKNITLTPGQSYDVAFWAKGNGASLEVYLQDSAGKKYAFGTFTLREGWNNYKLGPVKFTGAAGGSLVFDAKGATALFLDNVKLVEETGVIYLLKKNLTVDQKCDANLNDNLPGAALGCTAYRADSGEVRNLTGFSYLCRDNAIGCTALLDTHNTGDTVSLAYNIWVTGPGGQKATVKSGEGEYSCDVPVGESGCYLKQPVKDRTPDQITADFGANAFKPATVYVPADTAPNSPIYLVADKAASCTENDLGCTFAGVQEITPSGPKYTTNTIKNDPALYDKTLCKSESVGCSAFKDSSGGDLYFKNPNVVGQKVCTYQTGKNVNGATVDGWFWKGTGVCRGTTDSYCKSDSDCGGQAGSCTNIDSQPCYPDYFKSGVYDIRSANEAGKYNNFVGSCPVEQDTCTEFIDRNDNDAPHYLLSSRLDFRSCTGVSQKSGCILLDQTDRPNKSYDTKATYDDSAAKDSATVQPIDNKSRNDANVIVKVNRDRECAEWLTGSSCQQVFDSKLNTYKTVCSGLTRCDKGPDGADCGAGIKTSYTDEILTEGTYVTRDVSWGAKEFSGYSVLGYYPLEELIPVKFSQSSDNPDIRLVKPVPCGGVNCQAQNTNSFACATIDQPCGADSAGVCKNNYCVKSPGGTAANTAQVDKGSLALGCRAYPEENSPFPNIDSTKSTAFALAKKCEEPTDKTDTFAPRAGYACECDYTKTTYGDGTVKYWNYLKPNALEPLKFSDPAKNVNVRPGQAPDGICNGGDSRGYACISDSDCVRLDQLSKLPILDKTTKEPITDGSCERKSEDLGYLGWRGFCLETDTTKIINGDPTQFPCATWYPVDTISGVADINNQNNDAAYHLPDQAGRLYCSASTQASSLLVRPYDGGYSPLTRPALKLGPTEQWFQENVDPAVESSYEQQNIDHIILEVEKDLQYGLNENEDPAPGTKFYIWPNDTAALQSGKPQASYQVLTIAGNPKLSPAIAVTGNYAGKKNEFILFYGTKSNGTVPGDKYVSENGDVCYGNQVCSQLKGNVITGANLVEAPCSPNSGANGNWHAIKLKFDATTKKFTGYETRYCDDSSTQGGILYRVTFVLKSWCTNFADVFIDYKTTDGSSAIPWSNRLWELWKKNTEPNNLFALDNAPGPVLPLVKYSNTNKPFGSLSVVTPPAAGGSQILLENVPSVKKCPDEIAPSAMGMETCPTYNIAEVEPAATGEKKISYIQQLFARVYKEYRFVKDPVANGSYYTGYVGSDPVNTYTEVGQQNYGSVANKQAPVAPEVRGVGECDSDGCVEQTEQGIEINGKTNEDVVFFTSSARVNLRFFGFAHDDQMPIRRVSINWKDGRPFDVRPGLYQNHRGYAESYCAADKVCRSKSTVRANNGICPYGLTYNQNNGMCEMVFSTSCSSDADCKPQSICSDNPDTFGYIKGKSCVAVPFQFDNVYYCTKNGIGWNDDVTQCGNTQAVRDKFPDGCCIFKPEVQLKDNWGWCTGGQYDAKQFDDTKDNGCIRGAAWVQFGGRVILAPAAN